MVLDTKATQEAIDEEDAAIETLAGSFANLNEMSDIFEEVGAKYNASLGTMIGGTHLLVSDFDILGDRAEDAFGRLSKELDESTDTNKWKGWFHSLRALINY